VFLVESSGGGGYGDPAERDAASHAFDLANGFVAGNAARPAGSAFRRRPRRAPRHAGLRRARAV
jgi:N-methylhydantoinase B/oxoprolinase/acetone carboxylase alpha subunit